MRQIKFRYFWQHDETGKMTSRELTLGDIACGSVDMWTEKIGWGLPVVSALPYIGLSDKNNREIYLGDIVNTDSGASYVAYLQQECGYVLVYPDYDTRLGHRSRNSGTEKDDSIEVIGNIYENKDLLERP